jgi:glycosyltransferase involved in cell wall biosynthesis
MPFWRDPDGKLREVEGSFARYVDSLAPYFDEIVLCVPVLTAARGEGTGSARARHAGPLVNFDGPVHFYPRLPPSPANFASRDADHCTSAPTPAAIFAFVLAPAVRPCSCSWSATPRPCDSVPYRSVAAAVADLHRVRGRTQWMADRALAFANGAPLARKHSRTGRPVGETQTTTVSLADIASRVDTCAGGQVRVLTVSRIDPRKGLGTLPDVVSQLLARGFDVALDIVGPAVGGPGEAERRAIAARAAALGIQDRVRLLGAVPLDRLLPLYREYDLFVLPTLPGEGIPRVLLEAMTRRAGRDDARRRHSKPGDPRRERAAGRRADAVGDRRRARTAVVGWHRAAASDCQRLRDRAGTHARSAGCIDDARGVDPPAPDAATADGGAGGMTDARARVCFVLPSLNGGGAERAAVHILNGPDATRWDGRCLSLREGPYLHELQPSIDVVRSCGSRLRRWLHLRRYLRGSRPQIVVSFPSYRR